MRILVVDDEPDLCEILCFNLEGEGYETERAFSGEAALALMEGGGGYDLLLLDIMMEQMSGIDLARRLRAGGDDTPIIFLTARDGEESQLEGFDAGGDDYIVKPFSFPTVLARVKAVLKRCASGASRTEDFYSGASPEGDSYSGDSCIGDSCSGASYSGASCLGASQPVTLQSATLRWRGLEVDERGKRAVADGVALMLTRKEFAILTLLMSHRGEYFSRERILAEVWDGACVVDRSVDVHIARLRKKLGTYADCVTNRSGFGYVFEG